MHVDNLLVKSKFLKKHILELNETFTTLKKYNMRLILQRIYLMRDLGSFRGISLPLEGIKMNLDQVKVILDMPFSRMTEEV